MVDRGLSRRALGALDRRRLSAGARPRPRRRVIVGVVDGGATRAESVSNALEAVGHRAGRDPRCGAAAGHPRADRGRGRDPGRGPRAAGAIAATPVTDTIKRVATRAPREQSALTTSGRGKCRTRRSRRPLDRGRLWAAQTPQVFRVEALREALAAIPRSSRRRDGRGDAGRGGRGQGPDPPLAGREPQGDDAARPEAGRAAPCRAQHRTQTRAAAKQTWPTPRATPRLTAPSAAAISAPSAKAASDQRRSWHGPRSACSRMALAVQVPPAAARRAVRWMKRVVTPASTIADQVDAELGHRAAPVAPSCRAPRRRRCWRPPGSSSPRSARRSARPTWPR